MIKGGFDACKIMHPLHAQLKLANYGIKNKKLVSTVLVKVAPYLQHLRCYFTDGEVNVKKYLLHLLPVSLKKTYALCRHLICSVNFQSQDFRFVTLVNDAH